MRSTRASLPGFKEVAPRRKSRRIGRTSFLTCSRCGLANDTRSTAWANNGSGLSVTAEATPPSTFSVYENPVEQTATSGCKFCGSLFWLDGKPSGYPDSDKIPATGWKKHKR